MRITLIAPFATRPKGTTRSRVLPLATALTRRGHQVRVLIPAWDHPSEAGREQVIDDLHLHWLELRRPLLPRLSWKLAREARRGQPDLIHVFKPKAHAGLALFWLWLLRSRVPRILDTDDWEGRGGWNEINPYSRSQKVFFQWQESFLPRHCAQVVTVASRTLETQMWSLGLSTEDVFYLPNGASRARYSGWAQADPTPVRVRLGLGGQPVILLYTRFDRFDVQRVPNVLAKVIERVPDTRLLVVGQGFFGEEQMLEKEFARRGLGQHLIQAGWVEERDLPAYLSAGDVAYFPMDDTLTNRASCSAKLVELMVSGRAIVTDGVGQNRELLEHRISGWLTPPGAISLQAAAIVALLKNTAIRQALGENAQRRVWRHYDWDRLAEQAERAYERALGG
ncbi:MAG: glycosyltransferase family 4 protein [Chloroflexia bacterium]|nr:glycosyltransferase family 4 protein [Chloroflexia bacterium]